MVVQSVNYLSILFQNKTTFSLKFCIFEKKCLQFFLQTVFKPTLWVCNCIPCALDKTPLVHFRHLARTQKIAKTDGTAN